MITREISPGLFYVGVSEENLRVFGPAYFTESGIMYGSYLMDTGSGYAVIGSVPKEYSAEWSAQLDALSGGIVKWAVLFGSIGDTAAVTALAAKYPGVTVIAGTSTLYRLRDMAEGEYRTVEVRSSRKLSLGGHSFSFNIIADKFDTPSVYAVDETTHTLFTADTFGSVYADGNVLLSEIDDKTEYFRGAEGYYADIFGSRRKKCMEEAVKLVSDKGVTTICPMYGPVVDTELQRVLSVFTPKSEEKSSAPTVAIVYTPEGYIEELSELIETGILDSGELNVKRYNVKRINRDDIIRELKSADALLLGTPDVKGDAAKALWDIVTSLSAEDCESKLAAVFHTATAKGNAAENLRGRLKTLGFDINSTDYFIQGKPDKQGLKNAYEYGYGMGCSVLKIPNPRKPKLVKCLVCGEIFDASLGVCPVCGVGLDQCVPVDEEEVVYKVSTNNRYVILGGGIAALSAAESIRQRDDTGTIIMLSAEPYYPINRPMLTKDLRVIKEEPETLFVKNMDWFTSNNIEIHVGNAATEIDTASKTVKAQNGKVYPYDKLIYATGAECFVPPFKGSDKDGVLTIRHLSDSFKLQQLIDEGKNAVVIGGGVLGLEAASELMRAGMKVTVLEATPQIIGRQVDAQSAAILKGKMEAIGVAVYEGVNIVEIEGEGKVTGVRIESGEVFPADFVVISCGNRGNVGVAQNAGVEVARAVVVNQFMETSVPDIYACGDCCQFDNVNFQLWQEATNQGKVAGANAAGDRVSYANQLLGLSLEGFGTSLFALGDPGKKENMNYRTVETTDGVTGSHEKYWFHGGSLQGAVVIGTPEKVADITAAVTTHMRHDELFK